MTLIDTHLHLWDSNRLQYPWLAGLPQIQGVFLAEQYQEATAGFAVDKMIFIQAECLPEENLAELALVLEQIAIDPRIAGMVAYAGLEQGKSSLSPLIGNAFVKGVRRMYDDTPDVCCSPLFLEAARELPRLGLSMDISTKPLALPHTARMIGQCPETQFILDHLGKPDIRNGGFDSFRRDMDRLSQFPNLAAKLSGLITEAAWHQWSVDEVAPYIRHAVGCFGEDRLMFGSDWPVVLLAGTWKDWVLVLQEVLAEYPANVREKIWHLNAARYYRIS